jgi:uncharacterized protein (DUF302 family)
VVQQGEGLVRLESRHSVNETVRRLRELLESKGIQIFALVDHSGEAAKVGLEMRSTKLLVFGSPKGGTPLMQAAPTVAIDLPLKALIAEDEAAKVWLTWNDPEYIQARHGFDSSLLPNVGDVATLLQKAAE